jgi:hypothetical protein
LFNIDYEIGIYEKNTHNDWNHSRNEFVNDSENHFCLISGETNETWFESPITVFLYQLFIASFWGVNGMVFPISGFLSYLGFMVFASISNKNPFNVMYRISFGGLL